MLIVDVMASAKSGARLVSSRSGRPAPVESQLVIQKSFLVQSAPTIAEKPRSHVAGEQNDIRHDSAAVGSPLVRAAGSKEQHSTALSATESLCVASATESLSGPLDATTVGATSRKEEAMDGDRSVDGTQNNDSTPRTSATETVDPGPAQEDEKEDKNSATEQLPIAPKNMSVEKLTPPKKARRRRTPQVKPGQSTGRWTQKEHQAFLEGLRECGREWKKVAMRIPTRTSAQIRSHAQKYFSKIQRDQETVAFPDSIAPQPTILGSPGSLANTIDSPRALDPSVRRNVERIVANPSAVQREVESTLEALRERYRQLQRRLEARHHQHGSGQRDLDRPRDDNRRGHGSPSIHPRKRLLEDAHESSQQAHRVNQYIDDHSSVSSAVSASVASMGNDELIALQVLGGSLPRGESSQDLQNMGCVRSPDGSIASSTASAHAQDEERHSLADEGEETADSQLRLSGEPSKRQKTL